MEGAYPFFMTMKKKSIIDLHRISPAEFRAAAKLPIAVVLDNIRSLNNIGSIFRSSDAFAVSEICLCGITACPPSPEIHKTALGAEETVAWRKFDSTLDALAALKADGYVVCTIEQCEGSIALQDFAVVPGRKYALVLGHEVYGVDQQVVDASDLCIEIPQFGTKHSLNVAVTAGILIWHFASANF